MAKQFKDDKFTIKRDDLDGIRLRPTMIVGAVGELGVLHCVKEMIDNNRDECYKKESPGNRIDIEITNKYVICRDNGRGIPTNLLRTIHETTNAGSNMTRSGGATAGENGVGTAAYTALASELIVTTLRPQEKKKLTVVYREGKFIEEKLEKYEGKEHGLITSYKPSKKIMGIDYIPIDLLKEWLEMFDMTLPKDINMYYTINGEEFQTHHKTIKDYLEEKIGMDWMSPIMNFEISGDIVEEQVGMTIPRTFKANVAFQYTSPEYKGEEIKKSWMNMIFTRENGTHIDGCINGFVKAMTEKVYKKKKALEGEDIKKDILSNLQVVVIAECDFGNMFSAQAKNHVFPIQIRKRFDEATRLAIDSVVSSSIINEFVEVIIANNRVRREGEKARIVDATTKKKNKWEKPKSYIPCSSMKTKEGKELYIVEGLSAGGGLRGARDGRFQAILQCRGKSLNVWDEDLVRILQNNVWEDLVNILGCGIGASFDINKCNFDKIIIATDADVDGYHIRVGDCSFFAKCMPEIIEAGKLYIAEPPLYKLQIGKTKNYIYVASQREYIKECLNTLEDIEIKSLINTKASVFVEDAFNYLNVLKEASQTKLVNRYLLEFIAHGFVKYGSPDNFIKNIDEWLRSLVDVYKEIWFDHKTKQLTATIDLIDQFVIIDEELMKSLEYVIGVIDKYGLLIHYSSKKRNIDNQTTLARFFEYIEDFYPVIKDRYKGLGSSPAIVSKETIMDPRTRRLIQVTMQDVRDMQMRMSPLVGHSKDDRMGRKEILMDFKFTKDDIDT